MGRLRIYPSTKVACIYTITCPDSANIVYIGMTLDFYTRIGRHKAGKNSSPISKWISSVRAQGKMPLFEILEDFTNEVGDNSKKSFFERDWFINQMERYWITQFRTWGFNLLNRKVSCNLVRADHLKRI